MHRPTTGGVDPARAGGGALVDLAPHGIDLLGALLGGDDLTELQVLLQRRVHGHPVDDGAVIAGRTAGEALFSADVAFNTPDALPRRRLEVVGTRAQLVAENTMGQTAGGRLTRYGADGTAVDVPFDTATSPFAAQLAAFSGAVAGTADSPWPLERDLRLHRRPSFRHREELTCRCVPTPAPTAGLAALVRRAALCPVCTDVRNALPDDALGVDPPRAISPTGRPAGRRSRRGSAGTGSSPRSGWAPPAG